MFKGTLMIEYYHPISLLHNCAIFEMGAGKNIK